MRAGVFYGTSKVQAVAALEVGEQAFARVI
jgi:hypothetical protein